MTKARHQDNSPQLTTYGAVVKLQWLRAIAGRSDLSRATLAACCLIADMADAKSGICWPSYNTIAAAIGNTPRGTKKAIVQAIEAGLITIAEHGNRVRSNRYRINLEVIGGELQDTTSGGEPQDTRVVNASSSCSERQRPYVVNPSSPESIHLSEQQAKDRMERSQADGDSQSLRPERPTLANQPGRFDEFWQALGKRATVFESEQLLAELIADGVDYADILAGATRWSAYNKATGGRRAASPLKWLQKHKWVDGWTLPTSKATKSSKGTSKSSKALEPTFLEDGSVVIPDYQNDPEYIEWDRRRSTLDTAEELARENFCAHFKQCPTCVEHQDRLWDLESLIKHDRDYLCQSCWELHEEYREASEHHSDFFQKGKREWNFQPGKTISASNWENV